MSNSCVLGLNGWFKRTHDPSACLLINGDIVAMAEEERFIRKKHAFGKVPYNSIAYCLRVANITLDDVDIVGVGWNFRKLYNQARVIEPKLSSLSEVFFPNEFFKYKKSPKIKLVDHHLAHASSCYYLSGLNEASIITLDGQGEDDSGSLAFGKDGKIEILKKFPIKDSLGFFYDAVTQYLGFYFMDAGKTMGLASYGKPKYKFKEFKLTSDSYKALINPRKNIATKGHQLLDKEEMISDTWLRLLPKYGPRNLPLVSYSTRHSRIIKEVHLDQRHKDIAASSQKTLEQIIYHLAKIVTLKTGSKNLCLSGGVALNCVANGTILRSGLVDNLYIPPFPNDTGVSIGAALILSEIKPHKRLLTASLGPKFSNRQIKKVLDEYSVRYKKISNIEKEVAKLIYRGKVVSWFQGRMEVGPRALGNRSIVGNPCLAEIHLKLNKAKNRESWRPLAPSFLEEEMGEYLENSTDSPFMILSFTVKKKYRSTLPSLVHVDGTTRPQSVKKSVNPKFYKLISEFKKLSGFPVIMNTSFNGRGEPIVCNPYDALRSFYSNKTDYLAIGDYLVSK